MRAILPAAAILVLLLPFMLPAASAATGPFVIFASFEDRQYLPGETVNITVRTFARGEPAAPDGPPSVRVGGRELPLVATSVASWTATYLVLQADVESYGYVSVEARAYFKQSGGGEYPYYASTSISIVRQQIPSTPGPLSIRSCVLECPDGAIRPGSRLTFRVCATYEGAPVEPGDIRFWMNYNPDAGGDEREEVEAKAGNQPGTFLIPYTVPKKAVSGYFRLQSECFGISSDHLASVSLDFFNILYHELSRNGTAIEYELLVSDRAGKPVNGTAVTVMAYYNYWDGSAVTLDLGRTGRDGRVRGVADFGPGAPHFNIRGWANTSERSQRFHGRVQVPAGTAPVNSGGSWLNIDRLPSGEDFQVGGEKTIRYRAYYSNTPLGRQELDCYVRTYTNTGVSNIPGEVYGLRVVTGGDGTFSLNVTFPENVSSYAHVTVVGPGQPYPYGYSGAFDTVHVGIPDAPADPEKGWADISLSTARAGGTLKVSADAPDGAPVCARASWDFGYNATTTVRPWMVLNTFSWYFPARAYGQSVLKGQLVLPSHLKAGQNLTLGFWLTNASGQGSSATVPLTVRPAAAAEPPVDMCCITTILLFNVLLFAFVFLNFLGGRRAARQRALGELDADGQISAVLRGPAAPARDLSLPLRVELQRSEECAACARRIAQGNAAWRCVCGAFFHEHCTAGAGKCPSCGRPWRQG